MRVVVLVVVVIVFSLLKEVYASGREGGSSRWKKHFMTRSVGYMTRSALRYVPRSVGYMTRSALRYVPRSAGYMTRSALRYVPRSAGYMTRSALRYVARSASLLPPWSGQQIRLIPDGSGNMTSGLVEVMIGGRRGIVCDHNWDARDADIVCKQLGYKRGAANATHQQRHGMQSYDNDDIVIGDVTCGEDAKTLQECRYTYPSVCTVAEAAGVVCKENLGCPDGWTAGPTGCYLVPSNTVSQREYAINDCIKQGGHLVTIETEMEQHFLSTAFARQIGPFLTGGVKKGGNWKWEKVEEVETKNQKTRQTTRDTVGFTKWFPGWQPGNVYGEPTNHNNERCLFMTAVFQHPNGNDVTLDYLYWQDDQCTSTRKRNDGFHYICERTTDGSETQ